MFAFQNYLYNTQRFTPKDPPFIDTFGQHEFFLDNSKPDTITDLLFEVSFLFPLHL